MRHLRYLIILSQITLFCLIPSISNGQDKNDYGFSYWKALQLTVDETLVNNPWAGGMNNIQIGEIDLNMDEFNDLIIFDKHGSRLLPFIYHHSSRNSPQAWYEFDPSYRKFFPQINSTLQLHDYNGDSKPDIFTYTTGGILVYKNTSDESISFEKATDPYIRSLQGNVYTNLLVTNVDYPGIYDLDGDSDLDIITFWGLGSYMELHQNMSVETYGNADSLLYRKVDYCWGRFAEGIESNEIILDTCVDFGRQKHNAQSEERESMQYEGERHTGSTIALMDVNNDDTLDLLLGDVDYLNIQALINGGSNIMAEMIEQIDSFPGSNPVNLLSFPCVQQADIYNDNIDNIIVSPFDPGLLKSRGSNSVWMYTISDSSSLTLIKKAFLQEDMIDAGLGGYPLFAEITGDTLIDLLVSNYGTFDTSYYNLNGQLQATYKSSISLYKNTGTQSNPAFTFVTSDFGMLKNENALSIYPAIRDVNNDQLNDLLTGNADGRLKLYINTGYINGIAQFADPIIIPNNAGTYLTPAFEDMNSDGLIDFVAGNRTGKLSLFLNTGTPAVPVFSFITGEYGKVNVTDSTQSYTGYSVPALFRDKQNRICMVVGSESGNLLYYPQLSNDPNEEIIAEEDVFKDLSDGIRSSVSLIDLDNDGFIDMAAGNYAGGIVMYEGVLPGPSEIAIKPINEEALKLHPNPANSFIAIQMPNTGTWQLKIYNSFGQLVQQCYINGIKAEIDITKLRSGLYVIVASQKYNGNDISCGKMLITR